MIESPSVTNCCSSVGLSGESAAGLDADSDRVTPETAELISAAWYPRWRGDSAIAGEDPSLVTLFSGAVPEGAEGG
jgi:hypothetical protein